MENKKNYLKILFYGICMGSSDVVPGVSGGTMAFILGIYDELIQSIKKFASFEFISNIFNFKFKKAFETVNYKFLLSLGSGILIAILSLAKLISWALMNHKVYVWSFFFGLVLASIMTVSKKVAKWNYQNLMFVILGAFFSYYLVGVVPLKTPETYIFIVLSGSLAICAMILPGISGAYILVLLGKYHYILNCVNERKIFPLLCFGFGAAVGIIVFSQILGKLFENYHDFTVSILTGIMIGSLRKIWPWKVDIGYLLDQSNHFIMNHGQKIVTKQNNVLPDVFSNGSINTEFIVAVLLFVIGITAIISIEKFVVEKRG